MSSAHSASVAVLVEMSSAYGRGLIRGIAEYVQGKTAWSLHMEETGPIAEIPPWLKAWRGDGIIARIETPAIARALLARKVPLVNVSGRASPPGVPQVDLDNAGVCKLAVDYFCQRGFRHLAYCGDSRFEWSNWRRERFAETVAGTTATCNLLDCDDTGRGRQRLTAWLRSLPKPVGVLACNDRRGVTILETCQRLGLAVPRDIAVLGVDNDEILCTLARPQLSSIVPDHQGIGHLAAQTLHELLQGRTPDAMQRWVRPLTGPILYRRHRTHRLACHPGPAHHRRPGRARPAR